jgi:hypothetical protein
VRVPSLPRSSTSRARLRPLLLILLALLLWSPPARAETWGQYLVVVDDSGSMAVNDPRRLVMLASLALGAGLSDGDQIMIAGLNELANGEATSAAFVSPRELLRERDADEGQRPLTGARFERMAVHRGATPCKAALERAASILESVAAAGAPQTLLLLTDGACSGPVEPAATWLGRLRSHTEGRFRFALLSKKQSSERLDPALVEYATATGWTSDPSVAFDSRSLLRAFAEVLSFSRGLRYDDGGRVGLERSFAGAREVRVLAVSSEGKAPITLAAAPSEGREAAIVGGPTFAHGDYGWSLRVARIQPGAEPFAARSPDAGVEVLVIPSYGRLALEAVVGPCGEPSEAGAEGSRPELPWTRERAVRSGQPACAWARLIGDRGETIHPSRSFAFELELCDDAQCQTSTAMQPDADGTFNAQLGIMAAGRSERWFRARSGALAAPITIRRSIQAVALGITSIARADAPGQPIDALELGVLPTPTPTLISLEFGGSFPAAGEAEVRCRVAGDAGQDNLLAGELACLRCAATPATVGLQDPFTVQLELTATGLCPLVSERVGELPVALELVVEGVGVAATIGSRRLPLTATLRHALVSPQAAELVGGATGSARVEFPAPVNSTVELALAPDRELPAGLEVSLATTELRVTGEPGQLAEVELNLQASDCCATGDYAFTLTVRDRAGGPALAVPITVTVTKPSFWTCPGKRIAKIAGALLGLGFLIWLVRGFRSPHKFGETAVLARAESHEALAKLGEGDEDWRSIRSLEACTRGFYRHARVELGGPKAALPSLRELPADARIEAREQGNAALIIEAEGIETFKESTGWTPAPVGEHPIASSIALRRDDTYLLFRR